jgi:hypothetical protein
LKRNLLIFELDAQSFLIHRFQEAVSKVTMDGHRSTDHSECLFVSPL